MCKVAEPHTKNKEEGEKGNKNLYNGENVHVILEWCKMKSWNRTGIDKGK